MAHSIADNLELITGNTYNLNTLSKQDPPPKLKSLHLEKLIRDLGVNHPATSALFYYIHQDDRVSPYDSYHDQSTDVVQER